MPALAVFSKPNGLPIATARAPTLGTAVANVAAGRPWRWTLTTARSVTGSPATTAPFTVFPRSNWTATCVEPRTTWSAVTIRPSLDHTTPLPSPSLVMIVTTDGESFATSAGMPGSADGATAPFTRRVVRRRRPPGDREHGQAGSQDRYRYNSSAHVDTSIDRSGAATLVEDPP